MDLDAVLARAPDGRAGRRARPHQRAGSAATRSGGRTSRSCSTPASTSSRRSTSSTSSRLNDVVEGITGIRQGETVPDAVVRAGRPDRAGRHDARGAPAADGPRQHLRRRAVDAALGNYFRAGNLSALRELALLWVADRVDEALDEYRAAPRDRATVGDAERVVVALTGAPGGDHLVRRAARMAQRAARPTSSGCTCGADDGVGGAAAGAARRAPRRCSPSSAAATSRCPAATWPQALLDVARAEGATQLVLGAVRRSRLAELLSGSVINRVLRGSGPIDVHVISDAGRRSEPAPAPRPRPPPAAPLPPRRRLVGWVLAVSRRMALAGVLTRCATRSSCRRCCCCTCWWSSAVAAIGGGGPALVAAVSSSLYANWFFSRRSTRGRSATARTSSRSRCSSLVGWWSSLVSCPLVEPAVERGQPVAGRGRDPGPARRRPAPSADPLADARRAPARHLRRCRPSASLVPGDGPTAVAGRGRRSARAPGVAVRRRPTSRAHRRRRACSCLSGARIAAEDRHVMRAFAAQLGAAVEAAGSRAQAEVADRLGRGRRAAQRAPRARCPTTCARRWRRSRRRRRQPARRPTSTGRPDAVEAFASRSSRRPTGSTGLVEQPARHEPAPGRSGGRAALAVGPEEIVPAALESLGDVARRRAIEVDVPETCPAVDADPALRRAGARQPHRQRASAWAPEGTPVRIEAGAVGPRLAHPGRRPGARRPAGRPRADLPALPAARRPVERRRGRARASPWPAGSSRRSAASSPPRTRRAAARRWSSRCRSRPGPTGRGGAGIDRRRRSTGCSWSTTSGRSGGRWPPTSRPAATRSTWPPPARRPSTWRPRNHPDVVVLDLGLPGIDGVEVIEGLRGWTHGADHRAVGPRRRGATRSPRSTPAPTTTSPSRSAWASCWPGSARRCAAPPTTDGDAAVVDARLHRSTSRPSGCTATAGRCTSRRPSGTCSRCSCATRAGSSRQRQLLQEVWGPQYEHRDQLPAAATWPSCAASSSPSRAGPRYLITEPGMGYRFERQRHSEGRA